MVIHEVEDRKEMSSRIRKKWKKEENNDQYLSFFLSLKECLFQ
jgi:hypothetical protein